MVSRKTPIIVNFILHAKTYDSLSTDFRAFVFTSDRWMYFECLVLRSKNGSIVQKNKRSISCFFAVNKRCFIVKMFT